MEYYGLELDTFSQKIILIPKHKKQKREQCCFLFQEGFSYNGQKKISVRKRRKSYKHDNGQIKEI